MNKKTSEGSKFYVFGITLVATLGGLLFGYDTAVISGAEKSIQAYLIEGLNLSALVHGATTSSALIGCIIGGAISGLLARRYGRRNSLMLAAALFFFSALGSAFPETLFFIYGKPTMVYCLLLISTALSAELVLVWLQLWCPCILAKLHRQIFVEGWYH